MDKENEYTKISEADLSFLVQELLQTNKALTLEKLAQKVDQKNIQSTQARSKNI